MTWSRRPSRPESRGAGGPGARGGTPCRRRARRQGLDSESLPAWRRDAPSPGPDVARAAPSESERRAGACGMNSRRFRPSDSEARGKSGTRSFSGSFQLSVSRASMSWDLCPTELKPNEFSLPWRPGTRASCCGVCRQRRQSPPGPRRPSNPSESGRPAGVPGRLSGSWRNSSDAGRSRETSAPKLCCVRHFSGFVATYKLGGILHEAIIFGLINTLAAAIKRKCIRARFGAQRERPLPRRRGADTRPAARRQRESETAQ